jgi:hypothetical protein
MHSLSHSEGREKNKEKEKRNPCILKTVPEM